MGSFVVYLSNTIKICFKYSKQTLEFISLTLSNLYMNFRHEPGFIDNFQRNNFSNCYNLKKINVNLLSLLSKACMRLQPTISLDDPLKRRCDLIREDTQPLLIKEKLTKDEMKVSHVDKYKGQLKSS